MHASEWTVPDLLQLSGSYWSTCALHAAVKLDVFTALTDTPCTAEQVAEKISSDQRATAMLLDSLVAIGLLSKGVNLYSHTPFSAVYLSRLSEKYMGHIIMHHYHLVEGWSRLSEAVISGAPVRKSVSLDNTEIVRESFLMGMFNLASLLAPKIAKSLDLSSRRRLLDLGGGPGTYAIHFCQTYPQLLAVIYDLPTTRQFAEATVKRFDLTNQISFESGDFLADPVPTGFDVAWLSHVLHSDGPAACAILLQKAVASLEPDGQLFIQEFILNNDKSGPVFPALFSLNMLIGTERGQSYSESELSTMMTEAGLVDIRRLDLELPNGAAVLSGKKPV